MVIGMGGFAADFAFSGMASAIKGLYGMGVEVNDFFNDHIDKMKASENDTIQMTGRVMEGAKFGFGIGYTSSMVIIAAGQLLLGNSLISAAGNAAAAAVTLNPISMTCAAVGAIYFGWNGLNAKEKEDILEKLTKGLEVGAELIKSIIQFLISKTKELFSSENIAQFKSFIKEVASKFGKSLYDITGTLTDFVRGAADKAVEMTAKAGELTVHTVGQTTTAVRVAMVKTGDAASSAAEATSGVLKDALDKAGDAASKLSSSTQQALGRDKGKKLANAGPQEES